MGMGRDLAAEAATVDELDRLRRIEVAAAAVVEAHLAPYSAYLIDEQVRHLQHALRKPSETPPILWDIDLKIAFARIGGKLVATVKEQADGTWVMLTDDGRRWHPFRSLDAACRAFEESLGKGTAPARSDTTSAADRRVSA